MKKAIILVLTMCFINNCFSQINFVPNPSFEEFDFCPNNISQIYLVKNWYVTRDSPDYFNSCSTDTFANGQQIVNVPNNIFGYKTSASGFSYVGEIVSHQGAEPRELIGCQLLLPLQIGTKYYISFKVSLAGHANPSNYCGTNKLGALFSTIKYDSLFPALICDSCAQFTSDSIVTDTLIWTRLGGSFVADSNYTYLSIGRFNFNASTNFIQIIGNGNNSYYFIDDVSVSDDSLFTFNYNYTGIKNLEKGNKFSLFPNPVRNSLNINNKDRTILKVIILDFTGKTIKSFTIEEELNFELDVSNLTPGFYNVIVYTKNISCKTLKIIRQ